MTKLEALMLERQRYKEQMDSVHPLSVEYKIFHIHYNRLTVKCDKLMRQQQNEGLENV